MSRNQKIAARRRVARQLLANARSVYVRPVKQSQEAKDLMIKVRAGRKGGKRIFKGGKKYGQFLSNKVLRLRKLTNSQNNMLYNISPDNAFEREFLRKLKASQKKEWNTQEQIQKKVYNKKLDRRKARALYSKLINERFGDYPFINR